VRKADNLQPSCADVKKSGSLNLLEPCGPVQACNGTAVAFTLFYKIVINMQENIFLFKFQYLYRTSFIILYNELNNSQLNDKLLH
jgi:hypothetical protein